MNAGFVRTKRMRPVLSVSLVGLVVGLAVLSVGTFAVPGEAVAQSRGFEDGPAVRRVLLFRSDRFEVTPSLGMSLGDVYEQSVYLGASGDYHLTNVFSIGLNAMYAPIAFRTPLYNNFRDLEPDRARDRFSPARTQLSTDLHVGIVPFAGKLNFIGRRVMHYDVNIFAGFGAAMRSSDSDDLSGLRAGPTFGGGARLFIRDDLALRLRVQDHMHLSADAGALRRVGAAIPVEETMRHHLMLVMGVSFLFPDTVRVSR